MKQFPFSYQWRKSIQLSEAEKGHSSSQVSEEVQKQSKLIQRCNCLGVGHVPISTNPCAWRLAVLISHTWVLCPTLELRVRGQPHPNCIVWKGLGFSGSTTPTKLWCPFIQFTFSQMLGLVMTQHVFNEYLLSPCRVPATAIRVDDMAMKNTKSLSWGAHILVICGSLTFSSGQSWSWS